MTNKLRQSERLEADFEPIPGAESSNIILLSTVGCKKIAGIAAIWLLNCFMSDTDILAAAEVPGRACKTGGA
jgi:hypothetical protein